MDETSTIQDQPDAPAVEVADELDLSDDAPAKPKKRKNRPWLAEAKPGQVTVTPKGRRSKYSDEIAIAICKKVAVGVPLNSAAESCGILRSTAHDWYQKGSRNPRGPFGRFARAIVKARGKAVSRFVKKVDRRASENWQAGRWMLGKLAPEHFSDVQRVEHSGTVQTQNVNISLDVTAGLGDIQAQALAGLLLRGINHAAPPSLAGPVEQAPIVVEPLPAIAEPIPPAAASPTA